MFNNNKKRKKNYNYKYSEELSQWSLGINNQLIYVVLNFLACQRLPVACSREGLKKKPCPSDVLPYTQYMPAFTTSHLHQNEPFQLKSVWLLKATKLNKRM